jgi:hypothetical protein
VPSHFFLPDPEIFPQLEGLKLEADDKLTTLREQKERLSMRAVVI